jgi:hypothetical protein
VIFSISLGLILKGSNVVGAGVAGTISAFDYKDRNNISGSNAGFIFLMAKV